MTMLPGKAFSARRRTILVFIDEGDLGVQGYAVSRCGWVIIFALSGIQMNSLISGRRLLI